MSYESVREWCRKFRQNYANGFVLTAPGDRWHLDEVFLTVNGNGRYFSSECTVILARETTL